jgi:hypothetical protein
MGEVTTTCEMEGNGKVRFVEILGCLVGSNEYLRLLRLPPSDEIDLRSSVFGVGKIGRRAPRD